MKLNIHDYSAIIFDLGGVLLNIDYLKTMKEFERLGVKSPQEVYSQAKQTNLFNLLETGKVSPKQFRNEFRTLFSLKCNNQEIDIAWNAMLLDLPETRVALLKWVSAQTRMFLFSNTNAIHIDWFNRYLDEINQTEFFKLFEKAYLSHEVQMRKPNVATFEWVIQENNLDPKTTLFIDDSEQHILGAKKAGLQTYWLQPNEDVTELFNSFLA